jgi:hypothetical protein
MAVVQCPLRATYRPLAKLKQLLLLKRHGRRQHPKDFKAARWWCMLILIACGGYAQDWALLAKRGFLVLAEELAWAICLVLLTLS